MITFVEKEVGRYGYHSTMLLINGIIAVLILESAVVTYVFNIYDIQAGNKKIESKVSWQKSFSKNLPYFILIPIGIVFIFVVLMPIIFTFLTAFCRAKITTVSPACICTSPLAIMVSSPRNTPPTVASSGK